MGVLNKLKGRMSGLNALTKGPSKHHGPAHCNVDYMHTKHWDDMRKRNAPGPGKAGEVYGFSTGRERDSGVNAVGAGLAAGQAQQGPVQSNPGQDIHDGLAAIGAGLAAASESKKEGKTGKIATGKDNRKKELDKLQKDNPDMTRGEARKKRRKIKEMDKANEKYLKSLPKGKELGDEATGKGFGKCSA